VTPGEHRSEVLRGNIAGKTDDAGAAPEPSTWCLSGVDVVVLGAVEDLLEVVRLLAEAELADAQHGRRASSRTLVQVCELVQLVLTDALDGRLLLPLAMPGLR
jgi:hypothetical protein